jgi:hypothetical protein
MPYKLEFIITRDSNLQIFMRDDCKIITEIDYVTGKIDSIMYEKY